MAEELTTALVRRAERGNPRGATVVLAEAQRRMVAGAETRRWWRSGPAYAVAAAAVTLSIGGGVLLAARLQVPDTSPIMVLPESPTVTMPRVEVGAADEVFDVALAPDGSLWAATGAGVTRWDLETASPTVFSEVDGLGGRSVYHVAVAADGIVWAAGDWWLARYDGTWTVIGDDLLPELPSHIADLAVGPDGATWVAIGLGGNTLIRIDAGGATTYHLPEAWQLTTFGGPSIAVDPSGTVWVSTMHEGVLAFDGEWRHFGVGDGLPSNIVGNVAVAPDGTVWVGGGGIIDRHCCDPLMWNTPAGGVLRYRDGTWTVYTTADGLLDNHGSVTVDPTGAVWVVHDPLPARVSEDLGIELPNGISRFDGTGWRLYPKADGRGAGAVSTDGTLWLPSSQGIVGFDGTETTRLVVGPEAVPPVAPAGDAIRLEPAELLTLADHPGGVSAVAWSPDGTHLATGSSAIESNRDAEWSRDTVKVWDTTTGDGLLFLEQLDARVGKIAYSPDGTRLATGQSVYDAVTGEEVLGELGDQFLAYSPDGTRLVVGGAWGWSAVLDATTGDEQYTSPRCPGPHSWVWDAAWNPDGLRLATTCAASINVWHWDAATGYELLTIKGDVTVTDVEWSPDGTRIATASADGTIATIWDAATGAELATLSGHSAGYGGIWALAWSPDSTRIATASADGTAKIWDAATGAELATLTGHTDQVTDVAWSPDGTRIATASADGTVKIWQVG